MPQLKSYQEQGAEFDKWLKDQDRDQLFFDFLAQDSDGWAIAIGVAESEGFDLPYLPQDTNSIQWEFLMVNSYKEPLGSLFESWAEGYWLRLEFSEDESIGMDR